MKGMQVRSGFGYAFDSFTIVFAQLTLLGSCLALFLTHQYFNDDWPNDNRFVYLIAAYSTLAMLATSLLGRIHMKLKRIYREQNDE